MIEVEKKFQPTKKQLVALLADAKFVGEIVIHDVYYDYPDHRLFNNYAYLRNRNGEFELKVGNAAGDDEGGTAYQEINKGEDIRKFFNTDKSIQEFIKENLEEVINFKTSRLKYKKGNLSIDIDDLDFGYSCVEIELLVADESQIKKAKDEILKLVTNYGIEVKKLTSKRKEYFRLKKPELYKQFYGKQPE